MTKRIYFIGDDEGEVCEVGSDLLPDFDGECSNDATYRVEDRETMKTWALCATHKEEVKAAGIAQ